MATRAQSSKSKSRARGGAAGARVSTHVGGAHYSAADLEATSSHTPAWLIEQLWSADAVGILGGPPKSLKTWLALEMAVSVASGSACLGCFPVPDSGLVLLYAAEDAGPALRLQVQDARDADGRVVEIAQFPAVLGSSADVDVEISGYYVSARHCTLHWDGEQV